jgi:hypothetical protein
MRVFIALALFTALTWNAPLAGAQEPPPQTPPPAAPVYAPQDDAPPAQPNNPPPATVQQTLPLTGQTINVPPGTRVQMVLTTPINTHSTHVGDAVRAQSSFPVTIGTQTAIPAGTYAEGQITAVHRPNSSNRPAFEMRFTRLIFANGYAVNLSGAAVASLMNSSAAAVVAASTEKPTSGTVALNTASDDVTSLVTSDVTSDVTSEVIDLTSLDPNGDGSDLNDVTTLSVTPASFAFAEPAQTLPQPPPPPPLPKVGPSKGVFVGLGLAGLAAVLLIALAINHGHHSDLYLDAGSKFDLTIQSPLSLDASSVAAAAAISNAPSN